MLTALLLTSLTSLSLSAPPLSPPVLDPMALGPAALGPPTLCHPLDIGQSASLPWDGGAFGVKADYNLDKLAGDTYEILLRSEDPLVHVETLRRAVIYATGVGERRERPSDLQREALLAALFRELQYDADVHEAAAKALRPGSASGSASTATPASAHMLVNAAPVPAPSPALGGRYCQAQARSAGLVFLDLGFLRAALREAGFARHAEEASTLRDAVRLAPADPGVRLGAALGLLAQPDAAVRAEAWLHLDSAVKLTEDAPTRDVVRRNLLVTVGPLLNAKTHDELVQGIRSRLPAG
ncbi:MAG: hypothetical protein ACT4PU_07365 [Planctomycetota bacterium]